MTWYVTNQPLYPFGWSEQPEAVFVEDRFDYAQNGRMAVRYVPERTCRNEWEIGFLCSECGVAISGLNSINYCPNCGAKVVGE